MILNQRKLGDTKAKRFKIIDAGNCIILYYCIVSDNLAWIQYICFFHLQYVTMLHLLLLLLLLFSCGPSSACRSQPAPSCRTPAALRCEPSCATTSRPRPSVRCVSGGASPSPAPTASTSPWATSAAWP